MIFNISDRCFSSAGKRIAAEDGRPFAHEYIPATRNRSYKKSNWNRTKDAMRFEIGYRWYNCYEPRTERKFGRDVRRQNTTEMAKSNQNNNIILYR